MYGHLPHAADEGNIRQIDHALAKLVRWHHETISTGWIVGNIDLLLPGKLCVVHPGCVAGLLTCDYQDDISMLRRCRRWCCATGFVRAPRQSQRYGLFQRTGQPWTEDYRRQKKTDSHSDVALWPPNACGLGKRAQHAHSCCRPQSILACVEWIPFRLDMSCLTDCGLVLWYSPYQVFLAMNGNVQRKTALRSRADIVMPLGPSQAEVARGCYRC